MGGKHKQANRTKNNARPSSSSRSAELLGNAPTTFFGFTAAKEGISNVGVSGFSSVADDTDIQIDTNFQLILKKMSKKDSTTKLKALIEFSDLCQASEAAAVKTILPLWPRLYCLLCTDVEHRVREAANVAHKTVISKVKRDIAPYLKQVVGPWFTSQYDTYPPAATAAVAAFQEAFSPVKLTEAIVFCQEEILGYIYENLIIHTPQTLTNPKCNSQEEIDAKYERVVIASLQGYALYLERLSSEQTHAAEASNKKLLAAPKFWKYAKNKTPLIRNSFFSCLISLSQQAVYLLNEESTKFISVIFNNLDETDPVVLPTVWEAALCSLLAIQDSWKQVNMDKQVFPKLYKLLKDGGRGNATTIFPNILPLLSKLPIDVIKDKSNFYHSLFDSMTMGLKSAAVNHSLAESKVVASTFIECLKYIILKNAADHDFCVELLDRHLLPAVSVVLSADDSPSVALPLLCHMSLLLQYWHVHSGDAGMHYDRLASHCWDMLFKCCEDNVLNNVSHSILRKLLQNQFELAMVLRQPNKFLNKNRGKVKFAGEPVVKEEVVCEPAEVLNLDMITRFSKQLCALYLKQAISLNLAVFLSSINNLTDVFDLEEMFSAMSAVPEAGDMTSLFTKVFATWLDDPNMRGEPLTDLSLKLVTLLDESGRQDVFLKLGQVWQENNLSAELCRSVVRHTSHVFVKEWVQSAAFSQQLLTMSTRADTCEIVTLLLQTKHSKNELLIGDETATALMDKISEHLLQNEGKTHMKELALGAVRCPGGSRVHGSPSYQRLVSSILQEYCCQPEDVATKEACDVGLLMATMTSKSQGKENQLTSELVNAVKQVVLHKQMDPGGGTLERLVGMVSRYIDLSVHSKLEDGCCTNDDIEDVTLLMAHFMKEPPEVVACKQALRAFVAFAYEIRTEDVCCEKAVGSIMADGTEEHVKATREALELSLEPHPEASMLHSNFSPDISALLIKHRACYSQSQATCVSDALSSETLQQLTNWNMFVVGLLRLLLSAHPKCYKFKMLNWGAYCTSEKEEMTFNSENMEWDVLSCRVSSDERQELEAEQRVQADVFHEEEYQDMNNLVPVADQVLDIVEGVSLLDSLTTFYTNTRHHYMLKQHVQRLKGTLREALQCASVSEHMFCYHACRALVSAHTSWRMLLPTLRHVFCRKFFEEARQQDVPDTRALIADEEWGASHVLRIASMVAVSPQLLQEESWHQVFIHMDRMLKSSASEECDLKVLAAVCRMYHVVSQAMKKNHLSESSDRIVAEVCQAWNELVEKDLWQQLFGCWLLLADKWHKAVLSLTDSAVLDLLSTIVAEGTELRETQDPVESVGLAARMAGYLVSPNISIQVTAYHVLASVIGDLIKIDTATFHEHVSTTSQDSQTFFTTTSNCDWTCKKLEPILTETQAIIDILLSDFVLGDCCTLEPFTDAYTYTHAYLLLWTFLLRLCGEAHSPLRYQFARWLSFRGYGQAVLEAVFKLMPHTVLHSTELNEAYLRHFESPSTLGITDPVTSERLEQAACLVYRLCLQRLPVVVREWCSQADHKTNTLVDRITGLFVSPILIQNEMKGVQRDKEAGLDNMEVHSYPVSREVIATYTIEDSRMELIIQLPTNYPLGNIKIDSVNMNHTRQWLFQISKFLIHQSGSIWDALVIWKSNLDKKFEGVEECYICFSILHGASFETPKLCCRTCRKKFHSHCLYKWFSTSNKSTCPICRNLF